MAGQRDRHLQDHDLKRAGTLVDRLELMFEWYRASVSRACR